MLATSEGGSELLLAAQRLNMAIVRSGSITVRPPPSGAADALSYLLLAALILSGVIAVAAILGQVRQQGIPFAESVALPFGIAAVALLALWIPLRLWLSRRRRRQQAFLQAAIELSRSPATSARDAERFRAARSATSPRLPAWCLAELESYYRAAVAEIVSDRKVSALESERLPFLRRAFELRPEVTTRADTEAFLQACNALIADGQLTDAEDEGLQSLRAALQVSEFSIQKAMTRANELRKARIVSTTPLEPARCTLKLRKGEVCYYEASFVEQKSKIARSYVVDGVRMKDMTLEGVRQGRLHVTNERILLVAEGTTSVKLPSIFDSGIQTHGNLLTLTVDGRKAPYLFQVEEPYVAHAYVQKAARAI